MNRRIRDPYVRWCERCTGGVTPSAIYSIKERPNPETSCAADKKVWQKKLQTFPKFDDGFGQTEIIPAISINLSDSKLSKTGVKVECKNC